MSNTPRVDALTALWDDDGASRGAAFAELRELALDLEKQNAELLAALKDITNPIAAMQRDLPEGYSFNGAMAAMMADRPQWYISRAEKALAARQPSNNRIFDKWVRRVEPWSSYPIGTKARESWSGGYWIKTDNGWKWPTGSTFPTPGTADEVMLPSTQEVSNELPHT